MQRAEVKKAADLAYRARLREREERHRQQQLTIWQEALLRQSQPPMLAASPPLLARRVVPVCAAVAPTTPVALALPMPLSAGRVVAVCTAPPPLPVITTATTYTDNGTATALDADLHPSTEKEPVTRQRLERLEA